MPHKHYKMRMDKVRAFLHAMGARDYTFFGDTKEAKRKFRKIKRMATKRCHYSGRPQPQGIEVYEAIYDAFELNKYTMHGGYYWKDLRPLLTEPNPGSCFPKRRRVSQEEFGACRTWGLHGPVRKEYIPHCAWCGTTDGISKRNWPGNNAVSEPFCDRCYDKVSLMIEERKQGLYNETK